MGSRVRSHGSAGEETLTQRRSCRLSGLITFSPAEALLGPRDRGAGVRDWAAVGGWEGGRLRGLELSV